MNKQKKLEEQVMVDVKFIHCFICDLAFNKYEWEEALSHVILDHPISDWVILTN